MDKIKARQTTSQKNTSEENIQDLLDIAEINDELADKHFQIAIQNVKNLESYKELYGNKEEKNMGDFNKVLMNAKSLVDTARIFHAGIRSTAVKAWHIRHHVVNSTPEENEKLQQNIANEGEINQSIAEENLKISEKIAELTKLKAIAAGETTKPTSRTGHITAVSQGKMCETLLHKVRADINLYMRPEALPKSDRFWSEKVSFTTNAINNSTLPKCREFTSALLENSI